MTFAHMCTLYVHFSQQIFYCWYELVEHWEYKIVNIKAIGVVVMIESYYVSFYQDLGKAHTVVL